MNKLRIGHGFDVHQLVAGRPLILGGIAIPFEKGLDGHSDADVLLHAVMDALLGAAGLPDIGQHFPPSDMRYKGAASLDLLRAVRDLIRQAGCEEIANIDVIIMAERPKLNPYVHQMKKAIADVLMMPEADISIKATTTERLGFVGREEGMAASAVCLIACHG
jgi:2-C-methyl-D-erythritol 2,4-cyclodiphosphate synthase